MYIELILFIHKIRIIKKETLRFLNYWYLQNCILNISTSFRLQEESSFYTQINDFLSYIYPRYTQALELHVIRMLRILHVIPLKYRSDYKSNLKTSFHFALSVIPVLSFWTQFIEFIWSSPRPISDSQLHVLPHFHLCPIYLVVFKGSYWITPGISYLKGGFTLRCLQRLSLPNLATLLCHWYDNRWTSGSSSPVLSY